MVNLTLNREDRIKAFAVLLAGVILFAGAAILGGNGQPQGETTQWNADTNSCTIAIGGTSCSATRTWPTPLVATPCAGCASATLQTIPSATTTVQSVQMDYFMDLGNVTHCDTRNDGYCTGGNTTVLPNMTQMFQTSCGGLTPPGGATCISVDWSHATGMDLWVNCPEEGASDNNIFIEAQYSPDGGLTWFNMTSVNLGASAFCVVSLPYDWGFQNVGQFGSYQAIPNAAKINGLMLRLATADPTATNPTWVLFQSVWFQVQSTITINLTPTTLVLVNSATTISVSVRINIQQPVSTSYTWKEYAWVCLSGASHC